MSLPSAISGSLLERLGWVLLHFVWQGALLGAVLWAVTYFLLRRRSAQARYLTGCVVLLLMATAPVITFLVVPATNRQGPAVALPPSNPDPEQTIGMIFLGGAGGGVPAGGSAIQAALAAGAEEVQETVSWRDRVTAALPWLSTGWLVGVALMALRQLGGWIWLTRFVRTTTLPLSEPRLRELATRLVRRPVQFLESSAVPSPATLGFIRPIVLLPVAALSGLTPQQLEAIIAHELAHIRRWDYIVNVMQAAIESVLFFHPAVWWVSRCVRIERENCCDDVAVEIVGDRTLYASALERLELLRPAPAPHLALGASGGSLVARVGRLLGVRPYDLAHVGRGAGVIWVMACAVVLLYGAQLFAAASDARRQKMTPPVRLGVETAVYYALGLPRDGGDPLAAMATVLASGSVPDDEATLRAFAVAMNAGGDPVALARAAFDRVRINAPWRYQTEPGWQYGTSITRDKLLQRLIDRARGAVPTSPPEDRRLYARAAIALSAQEVSIYGLATCQTLLAAPSIVNTAELSADELDEARDGLKRHLETTRAFGPLFVNVKRALTWPPPSTQPTPTTSPVPSLPPPLSRATTEEIASNLRTMAPLTRERPELQWNLANLTWLFASRVGPDAAPVVAELTRMVNSPLFDRWMAEAAALPAARPPRPPRVLTMEETKKLRNVTAELRGRLNAATNPATRESSSPATRPQQ